MRCSLFLCLALTSCRGGAAEEHVAPTSSATAAAAATAAPADAPIASASAAAAPASAPLRAPAREGSTIARDPAADVLYVADEDLGALHVVSLPLGQSAKPLSLAMPGQPAQVLALADRVLVTIRSAGAVPPSKIITAVATPVLPSAVTSAAAAPPVPATAPVASASAAVPVASASAAAPPASASAAPPAVGPELLVPSPTGPGLLLSFRRDPDRGLVETARVELPQDAWGVAVTPDASIAIVTSAWTHKVTAVDLAAGKVLWSTNVAREPRGVVVRADGRAAYVTHLIDTDLTRIDNLAGPPRVRVVAFPASPLRTPVGSQLAASLAYAAVLSPDGRRLFVPRHALGALGSKAWFGAATVDGLITANDTPLAPNRREGVGDTREMRGAPESGYASSDPMGPGHAPSAPAALFAQPRAVAYLEKQSALLVAGEGSDSLVELDAHAVDPTMHVIAVHALAQAHEASIHVATACGAPSGIAVSGDEQTAWVHCRSTHDVVAVAVGEGRASSAPRPLVHLADDPLPAAAALGRRLFYNATDTVTSGGLGCAGCHPDGRDDGHVWRETMLVPPAEQRHPNFVSSATVLGDEIQFTEGFTRQTPMLAGRVAAEGPYGWHGESASLTERLLAGFSLHRWDEPTDSNTDSGRRARTSALEAFVRSGLVPPPHQERPLSPNEQHGRDLFFDPATGCSTCHAAATEYTDRKAYPVFPDASAAQVDSKDPNPRYKTPSLRFVGGTPPYLHDGRFPSLAALIDGNDDHMGQTDQLSASDKAALVAFLETL